MIIGEYSSTQGKAQPLELSVSFQQPIYFGNLMENLDNTLDKLVTSAISAVEAVADASDLDEVRVQFLGKKGKLTFFVLYI